MVQNRCDLDLLDATTTVFTTVRSGDSKGEIVATGTLVVSLPTAGERPAHEGAAGDTPLAAARSPLAGLRILVVDDEEMLRTVLDRFAALLNHIN